MKAFKFTATTEDNRTISRLLNQKDSFYYIQAKGMAPIVVSLVGWYKRKLVFRKFHKYRKGSLSSLKECKKLIRSNLVIEFKNKETEITKKIKTIREL